MIAKNYIIHANHRRPFKVSIYSLNKVLVFKEKKTKDLDAPITYHDKPYKTFNPKKIFIGKSPKNRMTKDSMGYGKSFDGNTILLQLKQPLEYVYIGESIFKFNSLAEITKYVSPVGNNNVPYPYAIDKEKNYYLLVEDVILSNVPKKYNKDPYDYYYDNNLITPDIGMIPLKQPTIKHFNDIVEFYIGDEPYTMRYVPRPAKHYTWVSKWDDFGKGIHIIDTKGKKIKLNKKKYIELMNDFGKLMEFRPLLGKKIIHK